MIPHIPFYFLRHGETDWNLQRKMMGVADIPLNATGRAQAEAARQAMAGLGLRSIAASPLARAWETAEIANRGLHLPMTRLDDLREVDVGPFQSISDRDWMNRWHAGEAMAGVESFEAFCQRLIRGFAQALKLEAPVLSVAHGGVFRALERLVGRSKGTDIPNATLACFEPPTLERDHWRILLA
jgi:broad specificity phosphatase PhoE